MFVLVRKEREEKTFPPEGLFRSVNRTWKKNQEVFFLQVFFISFFFWIELSTQRRRQEEEKRKIVERQSTSTLCTCSFFLPFSVASEKFFFNWDWIAIGNCECERLFCWRSLARIPTTARRTQRESLFFFSLSLFPSSSPSSSCTHFFPFSLLGCRSVKVKKALPLSYDQRPPSVAVFSFFPGPVSPRGLPPFLPPATRTTALFYSVAIGCARVSEARAHAAICPRREATDRTEHRPSERESKKENKERRRRQRRKETRKKTHPKLFWQDLALVCVCLSLFLLCLPLTRLCVRVRVCCVCFCVSERLGLESGTTTKTTTTRAWVLEPTTATWHKDALTSPPPPTSLSSSSPSADPPPLSSLPLNRSALGFLPTSFSFLSGSRVDWPGPCVLFLCGVDCVVFCFVGETGAPWSSFFSFSRQLPLTILAVCVCVWVCVKRYRETSAIFASTT